MVQRVCAGAMALFFLCFLLSGSGGGVQPRSSGPETWPAKRRLSSGGQDDGSPWHLFGGAAPQRPAAPPAKTLSWEEAKTWVRERLEALAAADSERGWRAVADPLAAFEEQQAPLDGDPGERRRRQLLDSRRTPGRDKRQGWDSRRAARRRVMLDEGAAAAAGRPGYRPGQPGRARGGPGGGRGRERRGETGAGRTNPLRWWSCRRRTCGT